MSIGPSEQFVRELTGNQSRLLAFVLTLLPDSEAAHDVLQNMNVVLWRKAEEYVDGSNFMAWACRIARWEVLAYYRDRARDRHVFDDGLIEQLASHAQHLAESSGRLTTFLEECLQYRSARQREMLRQRYAPGASVKEVAAAQGISANRLSVTLSRIRDALMQCIQQKLQLDSDEGIGGVSV